MITIGIPIGHFSAPWQFFFSLYNATVHLTNKNIPNQLLTSEGPIIEENRNDLLDKTNSESYLIMIDDDMVFQKDAIYNLYKTMANNNLDICCGLFSDEYGQPRIQREDKFVQIFQDSLFEVSGCGMAFTIFSPKVVKTFKEQKAFQRIGELGEDLSFCKKAREKGFIIYCDPNIIIGHLRLTPVYPK